MSYDMNLKEIKSVLFVCMGNICRSPSAEAVFKYKMQEKGAEALSKVLKDWADEDVLFFVMQMRAGDLWASVDKCDQATSYWQKVASSENFMSQQAQVKLGVCLQNIGRYDEAKAWFQKIKAKSPNSVEGFNAKRYLRYIEFKSNHKDSLPESSKAQQKDDNAAKEKRS